MKLFRGDYRVGDILTVHRKDGDTARGSFQRRSKRYLHVESYSIEAAGELRAMKGDRLLIPVDTIALIEVVEL